MHSIELTVSQVKSDMFDYVQLREVAFLKAESGARAAYRAVGEQLPDWDKIRTDAEYGNEPFRVSVSLCEVEGKETVPIDAYDAIYPTIERAMEVYHTLSAALRQEMLQRRTHEASQSR